MVNDKIRSQLEKARERLIDLTARNRLLNFRPTRRTTIQIVNELPRETWRLLVEERKALSFRAQEEQEKFKKNSESLEEAYEGENEHIITSEGPENIEDELFSLPDLETAFDSEGRVLDERYTDLFLQTFLPGDELQTNLLRTYQAANSALEERGVNVLFLAIGFLRWQERGESGRVFKAPILLVPVKLDRTSARRHFKLTALDDDPLLNPCLFAKLQRDYRIELPQPPEDWSEFDVDAYLRSVEEATGGDGDWAVLGEICLGLFSFAKYLMYVDLDPDRWPDEKGLLDSRLVRAMFDKDSAISEDLSDLPNPEDLDDKFHPKEVFQVLDADSSQQEAILAAKRGKSLVIQGPPGTGKSQTIANIIAECLAEGKTVLFVSEKMAALEVVKRRLDKVGLGDFCLELHSTKANRKAVAQELQRVLEVGRYDGEKSPDGAKELVRLRKRLNGYVRALHKPFGPSGITPYEAMGRVVLLESIPDLTYDIPGYETWTREEFDNVREQVRELARQMKEVSPVRENPWRGARLTSFDTEVESNVSQLLSVLSTALDGIILTSAKLRTMLDARDSTNLDEVKQLGEAGKLVISSPELAPRLLKESLWDDISHELQILLNRVKAATEIRQRLRARYKEDVIDSADWISMEERFLKKYTGALPRWCRPIYWSDRRILKQARKKKRRLRFSQVLTDLKSLSHLQVLRTDLEASEDVGVKYFGEAWQEASADWGRAERLARWVRTFRRYIKAGLIGDAGIELACQGADRTCLRKVSDQLHGYMGGWESGWDSLAQTIRLQDPGVFEQPVSGTGLGTVTRRLKHMADKLESLFDWAQYQQTLQACESSALAEFAQEALGENLEPEILVPVLEKRFLRLLMRVILAERPELERFRGRNHESDRLGFARKDEKWVKQTSARLRARLGTEKPASHLRAAQSSQLGILQGEIRRKRGGRAIRRILRDSCDAIQKIKPCLMMSPLSVAQFIDPHGMRFDVVIFDEASQVEPVDAIGAIARAEQLILVGDDKQLPPTNFFNSISVEGDQGEEEVAGLADMESILDRGIMLLPKQSLRWHYRSRHDSLVAFSNREFYHNSLVVFPSSHAKNEDLGLSIRYDPKDAYDRGRSQTNRAQAHRIAESVFEHARKHPNKSLGVGAFSLRQQQAILDEIEKLRRQDDSLEDFFDRNKSEPFFVKNLETIQGDERDVILISVGYGKRLPEERLSMNFGPLNRQGGERRLNVLITRARERCIVFSSIKSEDFDLGATQATGVHALKGYLEYATSGKMTEIEVGTGDFESPFERAVYNALTARGVKLHCQVGCAGFAIDLAAVDSDQPGKYILGIECDGASYHSSPLQPGTAIGFVNRSWKDWAGVYTGSGRQTGSGPLRRRSRGLSRQSGKHRAGGSSRASLGSQARRNCPSVSMRHPLRMRTILRCCRQSRTKTTLLGNTSPQTIST